MNFPNEFFWPVSVSMLTVISTERTQIGGRKQVITYKTKALRIDMYYFNTWSMKCHAHLTDTESTASDVVTNEKN